MDDWEGSYTSGGGVKEPTPKRSAMKLQLSLLAVAVLGVGAVASVSLSQQQQDQRSHASGYTNYQGNTYNGNPYPSSPPTTTTYTSTNFSNIICKYSFFGSCSPSPTPTSLPTPTPTRIPTLTPAVPTVTIGLPSPTTLIPTSFPTPTPTPVLPTVTFAPTATPVPGATNLSLTLALHGVGKGGDSVNPASEGNLAPLHAQRQVSVDIYNNQNQLVVTKTGTINYDTTSGQFSGVVSLGVSFQTGVYSVKVKTDKYLRTVVPGIQTINAGQTAYLPPVALVMGDINADNSINIVDYNILMGCYSDLLEATDCTPSNAILADLTDDGHVNQFDYNLFLRELSSREGQ
jgi:hypothetical protein